MKIQTHKLNKTQLSVLLIIIFVVLSGLFVVTNTLVSNKSKNNFVSVLGLSAVNNVYDLKIVNLSKLQANNKDYSRVSITINLKNNSPENLQISPGLQMFIITESGKSVAYTADYLATNESVGGPISPGSNKLLTVDFNVPINEEPKHFTFQPDISKPFESIGI